MHTDNALLTGNKSSGDDHRPDSSSGGDTETVVDEAQGNGARVRPHKQEEHGAYRGP